MAIFGLKPVGAPRTGRARRDRDGCFGEVAIDVSTMITVASTMIPKSIAPIDSRLADCPLITRMTIANSKAKDGRCHDDGAAQVAEEIHWMMKMS